MLRCCSILVLSTTNMRGRPSPWSSDSRMRPVPSPHLTASHTLSSNLTYSRPSRAMAPPLSCGDPSLCRDARQNLGWTGEVSARVLLLILDVNYVETSPTYISSYGALRRKSDEKMLPMTKAENRGASARGQRLRTELESPPSPVLLQPPRPLDGNQLAPERHHQPPRTAQNPQKHDAAQATDTARAAGAPRERDGPEIPPLVALAAAQL